MLGTLIRALYSLKNIIQMVAGSTVPELLNSKLMLEIYKDGCSLPVKYGGRFISDFVQSIRFLFFPLQFMAAWQARLSSFISTTISKVPPENRIKPAEEIIIPILQHIRYQNNDLILEMFSNLLAAAMDRTRVSQAHPGFIFTLCQLSPEEAVIIKHLSKNSFKYKMQYDLDPTDNKKISKRHVIENEFVISNLIFPDSFTMYLSHLYHLDVAAGYKQSNTQIYDNNEKRKSIGFIEEYKWQLTEYGELLVKTCVVDNAAVLGNII